MPTGLVTSWPTPPLTFNGTDTPPLDAYAEYAGAPQQQAQQPYSAPAQAQGWYADYTHHGQVARAHAHAQWQPALEVVVRAHQQHLQPQNQNQIVAPLALAHPHGGAGAVAAPSFYFPGPAGYN